MKMLGKLGYRCNYGCCRETPKSSRKQERRWLKRGKLENAWKREVRE